MCLAYSYHDSSLLYLRKENLLIGLKTIGVYIDDREEKIFLRPALITHRSYLVLEKSDYLEIQPDNQEQEVRYSQKIILSRPSGQSTGTFIFSRKATLGFHISKIKASENEDQISFISNIITELKRMKELKRAGTINSSFYLLVGFRQNDFQACDDDDVVADRFFILSPAFYKKAIYCLIHYFVFGEKFKRLARKEYKENAIYYEEFYQWIKNALTK